VDDDDCSNPPIKCHDLIFRSKILWPSILWQCQVWSWPRVYSTATNFPSSITFFDQL